MPELVVVCGNAGTGKTTWARAVAERWQAALLDLDTVSERLVVAAQRELGRDADDRDSPDYKRVFRDAVHETLFAIARECRGAVVIVAPFTKERALPGFADWLAERCTRKVGVHYFVTDDRVREQRLRSRAHPRDAAKFPRFRGISRPCDERDASRLPSRVVRYDARLPRRRGACQTSALRRARWLCAWLGACTPLAEPAPPPSSPASAVPAPAAAAPLPGDSPGIVTPPVAQLEPDGNDELPVDALVPTRGRFEKIGRHWAALSRVCDFAVHGGQLFLAHATQPLGLGGASITRFDPDAKTPWSLGFDWNRPGEPEKGGGAGQGFLRLRLIDERLYAPDADPPYLGLAQGAPIEGYVFVSNSDGAFSTARMPGHVPPRSAVILPGAVHVFDVVRFRSKLYASTSALIPPNGTASSSPGTLLTPSEPPAKPWRVAFTYAGAAGEASVRLGYMTRFRDRLYVAISPLYGADTHDFVIISPPREHDAIAPEDARAVRATPRGGNHTLRWYADRGKLYWISLGRDGAALRESDDGEQFKAVPLPPEAGAPSDVLRVGEHLLVLTEQGLYERSAAGFVLRAPAPAGKPPFKVDDGYCAAPLVAFRGQVYVGDQQRGNLWQLVDDAAPNASYGNSRP